MRAMSSKRGDPNGANSERPLGASPPHAQGVIVPPRTAQVTATEVVATASLTLSLIALPALIWAHVHPNRRSR